MNLLDGIRGLALISMIAYHGCWNMVYLYGADWEWFSGKGAYIWQQSICWTFLLLSGFCWSMARRPLKNGIQVFGAGLLVSAVTLLLMPQNRILFGVLTCIGCCMLIMIPLEYLLKRISGLSGILLAVACFILTRGINSGYLGWTGYPLVFLPKKWYRGWLGAWLGFVPENFYSTDYFSLFPWFFLFAAGYFAFRLLKTRECLAAKVLALKLPFAGWLGKHSLTVYLLHQPVLYLIGEIAF